jgi:hypothetical protein
MRKMLLAGLAALLVLLVLPGAVSAATDSKTVTVTGSIGLSVSVGVSPATVDFSTMQAGTEESSQTTVTVTTTSASWNVLASDNNAATKGYMYRTGPVKLTNALRFGKTADPTGTLVTDQTNFMSGTAAGTHTQIAYVEQDIAPADAQGSYTMTITFLATAN